ncbi:hypothetical protein ABEW05_002545 [Botrytis cinerea]
MDLTSDTGLRRPAESQSQIKERSTWGKFFALTSARLFDGEEILPVYDARTAQRVYKSQISEITYGD